MKTLTPDQGESSIPHVVNEQQQVKGLLRTFIALRHRNFRIFWFGQLISLIGTWMQSSAMLQAFILWVLVATGTVQIWHILLLASLLGLTNSVDMPTRQAFVAEMVRREHLPNAVALNSSQFNMARILGPGLGGLLIAWLGIAPLFLLNAISFIAVIVGLALIHMKDLYAQAKRSTSQKVEPKQSTLQSLREGLAYIARTPSVLLIIAVVGVISLFGINFNVVLPLFATAVLHSGP